VSAAPPCAIPYDAIVYVAGHRGLVGGAITRALLAREVPLLVRLQANVLDAAARTGSDLLRREVGVDHAPDQFDEVDGGLPAQLGPCAGGVPQLQRGI